MQKVIYDLGANNGDDIPYYLKKADLVVAVEANPSLCKQIERRFPMEITSGRLILENTVLTDEGGLGQVPFYRHKTEDALSQFPKPLNCDYFQKIFLPSISVPQLISRYGEPHYIKIDLEHYDHVVLHALFQNSIRPPYISAESHDIRVFALLTSIGGYNAFKLVEGGKVSKLYEKAKILGAQGYEKFSFPHGSAGPFGEDIAGEWLDRDSFFYALSLSGLGWRDIHATNIHTVSTRQILSLRELYKSRLKNRLISKLRFLNSARI